MANAISDALNWLKPTYRDFLWEKFQEEHIQSCNGRRICNSVSKYGQGHSRGFLKSVKADLEISYDGEIQGEDILTTRASPRELEAGLMVKARSVLLL